MRNATLLAAGLLSIALAGPAISQDAKPAFSDKDNVVTTNQFVDTRKGGEEVTCQDFLGTADQIKPQLVSYVIGLNKGSNPQLDAVDIASVGKIVPVVVSTCRSRPHDALRDTVSTVIYKR